MNNEVLIIEAQIRSLTQRKEKLVGGDEPCSHSYDSSCNTWCYYCPQCDRYMGETRDKLHIPLKSDKMCMWCYGDEL